MKLKVFVSAVVMATATNVMAAQNYADFPVTVKSYEGKSEHSVSYSGQAARQVLHTSLKKLAGKGTGEANPELKAKMLAYFEGKDAGRDIISPATKGTFVVAETQVDDLSKKKNLAGKAYKGAVPGWPGNMTGQEALGFMIDKASAATKGYDPLTGYDYAQLISKFTMGAVFYNQAVDNYLDEKLEAGTKPNNKAYDEGKPYTGKEHVWDEAFGYFGAQANTLNLTAEQVYKVAKQKEDALAYADLNKDGKVSLYNEMTFAHAYYAAGFDKGGKTNYLHTIVGAFVDGRQLISDANGEALTDEQRNKLKGYAKTISDNWEMVIAEAVFKYAGSTYKDLQKLNAVIESNGNAGKVFRTYSKHWGEMKGFALALQTGKDNLGESAVKLNRLIGFSPVLLGNTQVTGIDAKGNYVQSSSINMKEYMLHMLKVQKLMVDQFGVKARANDVMSDLGDLAEKLGSGNSAEND
ncbi:MAG: DUF4856 domain-containing protein [Neptuniibacter sp.]